MNTKGRGLHVRAVLGNIGITDAGQVRRDDREFFPELLNKRPPHARRLCVPMQQDDRRPLSRCEVVKLFPSDSRNARFCGLARFLRSLHPLSSKMNLMQEIARWTPNKRRRPRPFRSRDLQIYFLVASKGAKLLKAPPARVQPQARVRCWR